MGEKRMQARRRNRVALARDNRIDCIKDQTQSGFDGGVIPAKDRVGVAMAGYSDAQAGFW